MSEQKKEIKIKISDEILMGRYANYMKVSHTREEFVLEFANIIAPTGSVVAKIFTSPSHFKRIIKALEVNLKKYEHNYTEIVEAEEPKTEAGF